MDSQRGKSISEPNESTEISHFGVTHALKNYFKIQEIVPEVIYEQYAYSTHPVAKEVIMPLLKALLTFFSGTDPSTHARSMRNRYYHDPASTTKYVLDKLNSIAKAIQKAMTAQTKKKDNHQEYEIIGDAIQYCKEKIKSRLYDELQKKSDEIYTVFENEDNDLKQLLMLKHEKNHLMLPRR